MTPRPDLHATACWHRSVRVIALLLLAASAVVSADVITGRVIGITDGDTFTLLTQQQEQLKVRIAEIDAPERGQPYGDKARQALSSLLFGKDVRVDVRVVDRYGRPVGRPVVGSQDVAVEMVRIGAAWVYRSYSDDPALYELERQAKSDGRGLWGLSEYATTAPWDWRKGVRRAAASSQGEPFRCGTKTYCREMVSCDEAQFQLRTCGLSRLDGDGDGVPCEAICR